MMKKLFALMFGISLLMGCSGKSKSGGGESAEPFSLDTALVADLGKYSAKVCFDRNINKQCDEDEPAATEGTDGVYTINGEANDASVDIVAELTPKASAKSVNAALRAVEKNILEAPAGQKVISPLTTIVKSKLDANPTLSLKDAMKGVKDDLGIPDNIDLFNPADAATVSEVGNKVFDVLALMMDKLGELGITFSNNLMNMIYGEVADQLTKIKDQTAKQIVDDAIGQKSKEDIEQQIDDTANKTPKVYTAAEMIKQGLDVYWFFRPQGMDYNFCLVHFGEQYGTQYCNGGAKDTSGKIILPTKQNATDIENFILFAKGSSVSMVFPQAEPIILNKFIEIKVAAGETTLNAYPAFGSQPINFDNGAILYKISLITNEEGLVGPFTDLPNNETYVFNTTAAENIRDQWDENYIP